MSSQSSLTPVPPSVDGIAVPLPPMNAAQIPLPALPNTPASLADISSGAKFLNRLDENQRLGTAEVVATDDDLSHARLYMHKLCHSHIHQGDAAPNLANICAIDAEVIAPINKRLDDLAGKVDGLTGKVNRLLRISVQAYNAGCGSRIDCMYQIISFIDADGIEELPATYNLPPLRTIQDIQRLNQEDLHAYMDRYAISRAGNLARNTKLKRLQAFLGCSVEV